MKNKLIIAIDGPSGAGKSTLSKALASQLDYLNIDTGAMYRSVALLAQQRSINPHDGAALKALCADLSIEFIRGESSERVLVNGDDVSAAIRTPEVSLLTAQVAACPAVREAMLHLQRKLGEAGGVVLEGRDIGTVVFPRADIKFFLSATAVERGRRRYEELQAQGIEVDLQQTIAEVEARDAADTARTLAPLMQADDALVVDSTQLSIEDVLNEMLRIVKDKEAELAE
ncbi:MAG: (d)CMP kinase [Desulfuromusa sp.]|nr:(d)CMP kinase [Desulfuromusa sp.]